MADLIISSTDLSTEPIARRPVYGHFATATAATVATVEVVEPQILADPQRRPMRYIEGSSCELHPMIRADDIVRVRFDERGSAQVHTGGGLYLVEQRERGRVTWTGCRRMIHMAGRVQIADTFGSWSAYELPDPSADGLHVVGSVERVYRDTTHWPTQE